MANKSLEDIFGDQYPELPEQLIKAGIITLALLNQKVFNKNGTYFFEVLGYDMEDSDRIMGILRIKNIDDVLESFFSRSSPIYPSRHVKKSGFIFIVIIIKNR